MIGNYIENIKIFCFINKKYSPRSLSVIKSLGINENDLYFKNKNTFIHYNPKIKSQSNRYKDLCFYNSEAKRINLINRCRSERDAIVLNDNNANINNTNNTNNKSFNVSYMHKKYDPNIYYNNYVEKNKSMTNYWKCRYDKNRENERFYLIEKQNLAEIKNLIDISVKLYNKARKNNYEYEEYIKKEEEKNKMKYEMKKMKDKEYYEKEMMDKEIDLVDKKNKENQFRKLCLCQRKKEEVKEQKYYDELNDLMKKQQEWQLKNFEHMDKVENLYQQKHSSAINEYFDILKKDIKRQKQMKIKKENFIFKKKKENERREKIFTDHKNHKRVLEKYVRNKFENRHKHIDEFAEEQKEIKNNIIKCQRRERDDKVEQNLYKKQLNEELKTERRNRLLEQFEINEKKVDKRKEINKKMNEERIFNNYLRHDTMSANYIERNNMLIYKNLLKMEAMKNKNKEIEEKIKRRQLSAKLRMNRDNILKVKREQMIENVNKILDERKEHNVEDIYKRIFTNSEMKLLNE